MNDINCARTEDIHILRQPLVGEGAEERVAFQIHASDGTGSIVRGYLQRIMKLLRTWQSS